MCKSALSSHPVSPALCLSASDSFQLTSSAELYRKDDVPYYHRGNKILISICALSLVVFVSQREYLRWLNRRKAKVWDAMSSGERVAYQADQVEREKDGNKRLDFRFQY